MTGIRKTQEASFHPQSNFQFLKFHKKRNFLSVTLANYTSNFLDHTYRPKPFPSTGVFSILQSFCPRTAPSNEQGFSVFPNGTYVFKFNSTKN